MIELWILVLIAIIALIVLLASVAACVSLARRRRKAMRAKETLKRFSVTPYDEGHETGEAVDDPDEWQLPAN